MATRRGFSLSLKIYLFLNFIVIINKQNWNKNTSSKCLPDQEHAGEFNHLTGRLNTSYCLFCTAKPAAILDIYDHRLNVKDIRPRV